MNSLPLSTLIAFGYDGDRCVWLGRADLRTATNEADERNCVLHGAGQSRYYRQHQWRWPLEVPLRRVDGSAGLQMVCCPFDTLHPAHPYGRLWWYGKDNIGGARCRIHHRQIDRTDILYGRGAAPDQVDKNSYLLGGLPPYLSILDNRRMRQIERLRS